MLKSLIFQPKVVFSCQFNVIGAFSMSPSKLSLLKNCMGKSIKHGKSFGKIDFDYN